MRQRLFGFLAVLSLAIFLVIAWLWPQSYRRWGGVDWFRGNHQFQLRSAMGTITFQRGQNSDGGDEIWEFHSWLQPKPPPYDWSTMPADIVGIITPEMEFQDRYWWFPEEVSKHGDFVVYLPQTKRRGFFSPGANPGCWAVQTPYWLWFALSAILPLLWVAGRVRRRRRHTHGLCSACGYDLRATPGRCPECGSNATVSAHGKNPFSQRNSLSMKRLLFNLIAGVSLLLFVAAVGLWIRSYRYNDECWRHGVSIDDKRGTLYLGIDAADNGSPFGYRTSRRPDPSVEEVDAIFDGDEELKSFNGFGGGIRLYSGVMAANIDRRCFVVFFPVWSLVVLFAILPGIRLFGLLRSRSRDLGGKCSNCGYDLRATPSRCPECGRPAASATG